MGNRRASADTIRKIWKVDLRYCAQCWGPMDFVEHGNAASLQCPKQCKPGGHVSEYHVVSQRIRDEDFTMRAAKAYPELAEAAGYHFETAEELAEGSAHLFACEVDASKYKDQRPETNAMPTNYYSGGLKDAHKRNDR